MPPKPYWREVTTKLLVVLDKAFMQAAQIADLQVGETADFSDTDVTFEGANVQGLPLPTDEVRGSYSEPFATGTVVMTTGANIPAVADVDDSPATMMIAEPTSATTVETQADFPLHLVKIVPAIGDDGGADAEFYFSPGEDPGEDVEVEYSIYILF